jgi:PTS system mannose-specific IIA component
VIGVVIVAHGRLAAEFIAAVEHVVGPQPDMRAVSISDEVDFERRRAEILAAAKDVDSGKGVVILTDMFGGTPSNLSISVMEKANAEVIAGVNLPMLIKLASVRGEFDLKQAVAAAHEAGRKYINVASWLVSGDK